MSFPQISPYPKRLLLLCYDEGLSEYDGYDFREVIIEFLLKNGVRNMKSYVASSIYFEVSHLHRIPSIWRNLLINEFTDEFYFTVALVAINSETRDNFISSNPNIDLEGEFDEIVRKKKVALCVKN